MSRRFPSAVLLAGLLGGCAGMQPQPPVEMLDDRTGITVAALQRPLELVASELAAVGQRPSFAYLGPVEWNRMGVITQGLWVHLAPGGNLTLADIREPAALQLTLDDGVLELHPATAPALGHEPYRAAVPWGQSAYFSLSEHDLRRLAASSRLTLRCATTDGASSAFATSADPRPMLQAYLQSRNLTGD